MWKTAFVFILLLAGCTVGPNYKTPKVALPEKWSQTSSVEHNQLANWWQNFHDPILNQLVAQAIASNLDLKIATARIRAARAQRRIASAAYYPQFDASIGYTRDQFSENVPPISQFPNLLIDFFQVGFDANWEIDVFGATRRAVQAAVANIQAEEENRRDILVTLLAEVARNYIELRGTQSALQVLHKEADSLQDRVALLGSQYGIGLAADQTLESAKAQLTDTQAQIPPLESAAAEAIHEIALLLGKEPNALMNTLSSVQELPPLPPEIPIGLPSQLLKRRPDIRRSERELATATANIGVAVAALFPQFSLTGNFYLEAQNLKQLPEWASRAWTVTPSIMWPVFAGGQLCANVEVKNAQQEQALVQYEKTILTALFDVENALVAYHKEQERLRSLANSVVAQKKTCVLTSALYNQGLVNYVDYINVEQPLFESQRQLILSQQTLALNLVSLYKALGGGWEEVKFAVQPCQDGS